MTQNLQEITIYTHSASDRVVNGNVAINQLITGLIANRRGNSSKHSRSSESAESISP
jgi:hypothetical protein